MAEEPLLNISTLIDRKTIAVDGKRYEIYSPDELSVLASQQFDIWGRQIDELAASEEEADGARRGELVAKAAWEAFVDIPHDVFAKLSGAQMERIVQVFTGLLVRSKLDAAGAMAKAMGGPIGGLLTGVTSSPASSDSMADRRNGGWRKRLRRWFGRI